MNVEQAWEAMLRDHAAMFIGGEVEHVSMDNKIFRGPISSMTFQNKSLIIITSWTACSHGKTPGWTRLTEKDTTIFRYRLKDRLSAPEDIPDNRIQFTCWPSNMFGRITLFHRDDCKLDPKKVKGL